MKLTLEEKKQRASERKALRLEQKDLARIEAEKNQKPVKSLAITIEWKKSRTWGNVPHASATVGFHDGTYARSDGFTAGGCGYDKESTVVAEIFNKYLKYKLYILPMTEKRPYGMYRDFFGGGIGMRAYESIAKTIGGELKSVASGKTFDVYIYKETKCPTES